VVSIGVLGRRRSSAHTYLCVELGKSSMEIKLLEKTQIGSIISIALVYRWHRWVSEDSSAH